MDKKSKLSKKHLKVENDSFSKMNVPFALDVFSQRTVSVGASNFAEMNELMKCRVVFDYKTKDLFSSWNTAHKGHTKKMEKSTVVV